MSRADMEMLSIKMIDLGLSIASNNTSKEVAEKYNQVTALLVQIMKELNSGTSSTYKIN